MAGVDPASFHGVYLHDGARLYFVLDAVEGRLLLEDAQTLTLEWVSVREACEQMTVVRPQLAA